MAFNDRIKKIRKNLRQNQEEMANTIGVSKRAYCNYEKGTRTPGALTLIEYAILDYNIDWILTGDGDMNRRNTLGTDSYLRKIYEWKKELEKEDSKRKDWFEMEFERQFPEFKEWLKKRDSDSKYMVPQKKTA